MSDTGRVLVATIMREHGETGVQAHVNALRAYALANGVEISVVTPFTAAAWLVYPVFAPRRILDRLHGPSSVWWYRFWHYAFLRVGLSQALRRDPALVIYAQCPLSARAALAARKSPRQQVCMAVHFNISQAHEWYLKGKISPGSPVFRGIVQLEQSVLPALDGIVFVSQFMRETLEEAIPGVAGVRAAVIPNFVNPPDTTSSPVVTGDLVSIGSLEARKNQAFLIRVLDAARVLDRRYSLTLIGDGPDRFRLEQLTRSLGLDAQVRFLGFQQDAARLLPGHRALVHAATMENLPVVFIEAMSYGLPVFAAPVGGVPEVLQDGRQGHHWSLDDPAEGARKLVALLEDPMRYASVSHAARRHFHANFSASVVADRLIRFLCEPGQVLRSG